MATFIVLRDAGGETIVINADQIISIRPGFGGGSTIVCGHDVSIGVEERRRRLQKAANTKW